MREKQTNYVFSEKASRLAQFVRTHLNLEMLYINGIHIRQRTL